MAYTNLMNQLQGQQQKQNIFAADPQAAQQAQGQAQQVSQPEAKTTTQGQVQGGGGAEAQSDKPGDSPDSAAAGAVQQNIGRATAPQQGISRLAGSIAQQRQAQQQAADAFVQGAQAQQVGQSEIDRAIAGDQAASQQLTQLLSGQRQQAGEFRAPTVDTARARRFFDDTGRLSTSGLARQFREQGGQQYTGAQAAFDAALARRNRDVQRSAFQLGQQLEEADAAGAEVQRSAQERAQAQIDAQRQQQQEEARKYLAGQRADIQATAQQQAQAANLAAQQGPDLQAAALERFIAENPGMAEDIRAGAGRIQDIDPYMVAGQDITEQYTPEQAARFNRILALLGEGGQGAVAGAAPTAASFREDDYRNAILGQVDAIRAERLAAQQAEQQRLASEEAARLEAARVAEAERLAQENAAREALAAEATAQAEQDRRGAGFRDPSGEQFRQLMSRLGRDPNVLGGGGTQPMQRDLGAGAAGREVSRGGRQLRKLTGL